jgi:hypothetical protein
VRTTSCIRAPQRIKLIGLVSTDTRCGFLVIVRPFCWAGNDESALLL